MIGYASSTKQSTDVPRKADSKYNDIPERKVQKEKESLHPDNISKSPSHKNRPHFISYLWTALKSPVVSLK